MRERERGGGGQSTYASECAEEYRSVQTRAQLAIQNKTLSLSLSLSLSIYLSIYLYLSLSLVKVGHGAERRYKPWPRVAAFLRELGPSSLVADVGCGNGRYLGCASAGSVMVGMDRCGRGGGRTWTGAVVVAGACERAGG